jgi:hypothetical protein
MTYVARQPCQRADLTPKAVYKSEHAAQTVAERTNRAHRNDEPVRAYLCDAPGRDAHWHVGHSGLWL